MPPVTPLLLPYWNHTGQVHDFEPYPQSFHDWTLGEEILADHQSLHDAVPAILNHALVRTSCKAREMNIVRLECLETGVQYMCNLSTIPLSRR